jgi:hypothetical protein
VHARRGHQIFSKRIVTSQLHVDVLPVVSFLIPEYLTYENVDRAMEISLLIAALKLASSFGLVFKWFGEVVCEGLEPGGTISVT